MRKLKIIQTPARFYPYIRGVEKYVYDLSRELVKNGNKVKIICADEPKSKIKEVEGISIERLKYIAKIANTNITSNLFFKLFREDFDIIHTHIPTPWSADVSMLVSVIKRKPLILTYHNDLSKEGIESIVARIYSATLLKLLFRNSKKIIITNPQYVKRSRYLKGLTKKIEIIPNGINIKEFKLNPKIKKEENQIFFLSVLDAYHKYKGLDYLLYSMPEIIKKNPKVKLLIGGSGKLVNEYKSLAKKLRISKNVNFLGYVEPLSLKKIYQKSSVFILPSIDNNEGFGIVLLEAMAYKIPVITTTSVGIADDVAKYRTGIVVDPKNPKQLSDSIITLLKNKNLLKQMGENGRKLVEVKYNWDKNIKKVKNLYLEATK